MKEFKKPTVEMISFANEDVIATSDCGCDGCTVCPEGKNNCPCHDFGGNN